MKYNDINIINNKNKGQQTYKKHICITEPDTISESNNNPRYHHNRNLSSSVIPGANKMINNIYYNLTPNNNKIIPFGSYNLTPRNLNFQQSNFGIVNNNLIYNNHQQINHQNNFGNIMYKNNTGSFISQSNYSSSNKVKDCYENNEESTEIGDNSHEE